MPNKTVKVGIVKLSMDTLHIYFGTRKEVYAAAVRDADQHVIRTIITHKGNLTRRTSLLFRVQVKDDDILRKPNSMTRIQQTQLMLRHAVSPSRFYDISYLPIKLQQQQILRD